MILKNDRNSPRWLPAVIGGILLGVLVLVYFLSLSSSEEQTEMKAPEGAIVCDAEQTEGEMFKTGDHLFFRGKLQSTDFAFSGTHSCKLEEAGKRQYGFSYKLENPIPGMSYKASVWRLKNTEAKSVLVVDGPPGSDFYRKEPLGGKMEKGWEQLEIIFSIPYNKQMDFIQIYVYSDGSGSVYFDDLGLMPLGPLSVDSDVFDLDTIRLTIPEKGMEQLEAKRLEAFRNGILESKEDDWIKGSLSSKEGESKKVKLRLKGDWLNHLKGDKWSFRVKLRVGDAWNHLRHFSLHTPEARGFLHEWLLHQFFEQEDVLTTTYEFVLLELNGKPLGVYALEEHFDKVLVESRKRREGVLVKLSESGFWSSVKRQLHYTDRVVHGLAQPEKSMGTAEVLPFGESTTLSSPILTQQLQQARKLLQRYLTAEADVATVFDIDRMARYFAICDVMGAYHGTAWHNMRFYYNPLSAKLEPVGYDGFEKARSYRDSFLGQGALNVNKLKAEKFYFRLFLDKTFVEKYVAYLYDFSTKEKLKNLFAKSEAGLYAREKIIQNEFQDYEFNSTSWLKDALSMHLMILPFNDISLKAYTQEKKDGNLKIKAANIHGLPIELLGYGVSENKIVQRFEEPILLEGYHPRSTLEAIRRQEQSGIKMDSLTKGRLHKSFEEEEPLQQKELSVSAQATHLFYKPLGLDTLMYSRISSWPSPYDPVIEKSLFAPSEIADNSLFQIDGNILFFRKGKHELKEPLVIPKGYRLHFEEGCQIDLQAGAFLWSASPITVRGTEQEPVLIHSTDGKGRGFHLMEAKEESVLRYAHFDGLNTIDVKERRLTGAVTFYESPVIFHHCLFRNNQCEDALNLIRSEFEMYNSIVTLTYADGLDADFCKGKIKGSRFANTGNDGLDVSGSVILIQDCFFDKNGDKAISIGEASDASILSATITNAPIAVAVKDLSTLAVSTIRLKDCRQGFVAFQKKPEYGTGKIIVENYEAEGVTKLYNGGGNIILKQAAH